VDNCQASPPQLLKFRWNFPKMRRPPRICGAAKIRREQVALKAFVMNYWKEIFSL
jgi:hypothetical protein